MIKIVITSSDVRNMAGIGKVSGKPYDLNFQTAHAFTVSPDGVCGQFPDKFEIMLDKGQPPYAPGNYTLSPAAVYVSRDGNLDIKPRLTLAPAGK